MVKNASSRHLRRGDQAILNFKKKKMLFNYAFQNLLYLDLFGRTTSATLGRLSSV